MRKRKNNKGFTLAELLIVVAIIAVVAMVAIPIFTSKLEKSREATDLAKVRNAYASVMTAAMMNDTGTPNADGVTCMHDRWYIQVELEQKQADWQTQGTIYVGELNSNNSVQWVGRPTPGGHCLVSYSVDKGAVVAWEYNFAQIMNVITIKQDGAYKGKTVTQLLKQNNFSMLESSGSTGQYIASEIKHQLGLKTSDDFSYKILPAPEYGKDYYQIYISENYTLKTGLKASQPYTGNIDVTGYIYHIDQNGASSLVKRGTTQTLATYTNKSGQEKIDAFGNQDNQAEIKNKVDNPAYTWE